MTIHLRGREELNYISITTAYEYIKIILNEGKTDTVRWNTMLLFKKQDIDLDLLRWHDSRENTDKASIRAGMHNYLHKHYSHTYITTCIQIGCIHIELFGVVHLERASQRRPFIFLLFCLV